MTSKACVSEQGKSGMCGSCCRGVQATRALVEDLVIDQPWLWILIVAGLGVLLGRFVFKRDKTSE